MFSSLHRAARGELANARQRLEASGSEEELVQLACKCLAGEKKDRPRHAGEVADAVGGYLAGVQERLRAAERQRVAAEARAVEARARVKAERRARRLLLGLVAAVLLSVLVGGSGAWIVQQQWAAAALAHQVQIDQETVRVLERARGLLDEGWQAHDLTKLTEGKTEGERAVDRARAGASLAVLQRAAEFQMEAGERLERARKNEALREALLDVSAPRETSDGKGGYGGGLMASRLPSPPPDESPARLPSPPPDEGPVGVDAGDMMALPKPSVEEQYATAFHQWGLDVERVPEAEVVARLQQEPEVLVQELIAGLDGWMVERWQHQHPARDWWRLYRVAEQLDHSDQRRLLRRVLIGEEPRAESVAGLLGMGLPWPALWELGRGNQWRRLQLLRRQMDPRKEPVLTVVLLAQASNAVGDTAEAEKVLRRALATRPNQVVLLETLGNLLESQQPWRSGEAIECFRAARAVRPHLGVALGLALSKVGRAEEGVEILRDLLRQRPDNPEAYKNLGKALAAEQNPEEAVASYRKAVELKPDWAEGYYELGFVLHVRAGKLDEAVAAYREAIRLKSNYAFAYYCLGVALHAQQRLDAAATAYRKAIELIPDYPYAHSSLGSVLIKQKKLDDAVAEFQKANQRAPNDPWIRGALQKAELWLELNSQLPAILARDVILSQPAEQLDFAWFCLTYKERYATAARYFADAFAAAPKQANNVHAQHRYNAARATALAAAGKGEDVAGLTGEEVILLRFQALRWLRADRSGWTKLLEQDPFAEVVQRRMECWQQDKDLADVRHKDSLAKLPEAERKEWEKLWADVAALRKRAADVAALGENIAPPRPVVVKERRKGPPRLRRWGNKPAASEWLRTPERCPSMAYSDVTLHQVLQTFQLTPQRGSTVSMTRLGFSMMVC
jgi:tetratricopeptide (TPR) repeat protein